MNTLGGAAGPNVTAISPASSSTGVSPVASWFSTGTTWTMFATGRISCTAAMKIGNTLLTRYRAARERSGGAIKPALKGFDVCGTKPGQASCHDLRDASNITLFETGTYSLAQVKQFVAAGKLPLGKR